MAHGPPALWQPFRHWHAWQPHRGHASRRPEASLLQASRRGRALALPASQAAQFGQISFSLPAPFSCRSQARRRWTGVKETGQPNHRNPQTAAGGNLAVPSLPPHANPRRLSHIITRFSNTLVLLVCQAPNNPYRLCARPRHQPQVLIIYDALYWRHCRRGCRNTGLIRSVRHFARLVLRQLPMRQAGHFFLDMTAEYELRGTLPFKR